MTPPEKLLDLIKFLHDTDDFLLNYNVLRLLVELYDNERLQPVEISKRLGVPSSTASYLTGDKLDRRLGLIEKDFPYGEGYTKRVSLSKKGRLLMEEIYRKLGSEVLPMTVKEGSLRPQPDFRGVEEFISLNADAPMDRLRSLAVESTTLPRYRQLSPELKAAWESRAMLMVIILRKYGLPVYG